MLKHVIKLLLILSLIFVVSCKGGSKKGSSNMVNNPSTADSPESKKGLPIIVFDKNFHDFGKLVNGEEVTYSFKFTNKGEGFLLISAANSSCGCTVTKFPTKPIAPGNSGTIDVSFDSEGRVGLNNKSVTIISNTQPNTTVLKIQATVVNPEDL
ncbi:MAG: DUF1573 domain-containing protein [Bacteroidales bacterium]|jgi:hypothetical protein